MIAPNINPLAAPSIKPLKNPSPDNAEEIPPIVPEINAPDMAPATAPLKAPATINPATPADAPPVTIVAIANAAIINPPINHCHHGIPSSASSSGVFGSRDKSVVIVYALTMNSSILSHIIPFLSRYISEITVGISIASRYIPSHGS